MSWQWTVCIIFICSGLLTNCNGVLWGPKTKQFREGFQKSCEEGNKKISCKNVWPPFERAYKGKDKCNVYETDYNAFMDLNPFNHPSGKTMFWSKTDGLVHKYTKNKDCYTLEDTWLGRFLDKKEWCGKKNSEETFFCPCPGYNGCENSPVRSFWRSASAKFAGYASGEVSVMLDGSYKQPFDPTSTFGSIEIQKLNPSKVTKMKVILVAGKKSNCASANLQEIKEKLPQGICFTCKEVPRSRIKACISDNSRDCEACLLNMSNMMRHNREQLLKYLFVLVSFHSLLIH